MRGNTHMVKKILLETTKEGQRIVETHVTDICKNYLNNDST